VKDAIQATKQFDVPPALRSRPTVRKVRGWEEEYILPERQNRLGAEDQGEGLGTAPYQRNLPGPLMAGLINQSDLLRAYPRGYGCIRLNAKACSNVR
jgi:hypothetical protein